MGEEVLLDRAAAAREVATVAALALIQTHGDVDRALVILTDGSRLVPPEGDELDAASIAAQGIRDALAFIETMGSSAS